MAHRGRVLGWGVAVALLAFGIAGPSAAFANDGSAGESDTVTNPQLPIAETPTPDPTTPEDPAPEPPASESPAPVDPALEPPASETPAPEVPGSEGSESDPEPTETPVPVDDAATTPPAEEVSAEETPAPAAAVAATDVAVVMTANGMEGPYSAVLVNLLADTPVHFVYSVTNNSDADITITSLVDTIGGDIMAVDGDGTTIAAGATEQYTRADASFPVGRGQIDLSVSFVAAGSADSYAASGALFYEAHVNAMSGVCILPRYAGEPFAVVSENTGTYALTTFSVADAAGAAVAVSSQSSDQTWPAMYPALGDSINHITLQNVAPVGAVSEQFTVSAVGLYNQVVTVTVNCEGTTIERPILAETGATDVAWWLMPSSVLLIGVGLIALFIRRAERAEIR